MKTNPSMKYLAVVIALLALCQGKVKSQDAVVNPQPPTKQNPDSKNNQNARRFADKGCFEVGGAFAYTNQSVSGSPLSSSLLAFAPMVGWFPCKGFEVGIYPLSVTSDLNGNTVFMPAIAPAYNINTNSIIYPFIEGDLGYISYPFAGGFSYSSSTVYYGGRLGFKIAINKGALLHFSFQYLYWSFTENTTNGYYYPYTTTQTVSFNNINTEVGFTVFF